MLKYLYSKVTFSEVPDEINLSIEFSNCHIKCKGCHSPELWEDVGTPLTFKELDKLIASNNGITCVCLMGGETDSVMLFALAKYIRNHHNLKVAWYCGRKELPSPTFYNAFDYIKVGPYIEELGGLNSPQTNQRFYEVKDNKLIDATYKFQRHVQ